MKIKDVQKFKEEVRKNLKSLYFVGYEITGVSETWFDDVAFEAGKVTHLYDVAVEIVKYHRDKDWRTITDDTFFVTVDDLGAQIWWMDKENKCYKWIDNVHAEYEPNKTVFFMELAMKVMKEIGA